MNKKNVIVLIVETPCKKLSPLSNGKSKKIEKIPKNVRFFLSCHFDLRIGQKTILLADWLLADWLCKMNQSQRVWSKQSSRVESGVWNLFLCSVFVWRYFLFIFRHFMNSPLLLSLCQPWAVGGMFFFYFFVSLVWCVV